MIRLATVELIPKLLLGHDPEVIVLMLRCAFWYTDTNAAYMRRASAALQAQGRAAVDTMDARQFLYGLAQEGVVRMEES